MSLENNLQSVNSLLKKDVTLVAVSKTKPVADIEILYGAGQRDFGENKVQELVGKYEQLPKDIRWHQIGHLQKNKVKYIASFVELIHSLDSEELLKEINKQAQKHNRIIKCLLQIHIAQEETKFGADETEAREILAKYSEKYPFAKIIGLMGMASFTDNEDQIRSEFQRLKSIFDNFKLDYPELEILSMGMSGDFEIAMEEGSNMVRVGSSIFGSR